MGLFSRKPQQPSCDMCGRTDAEGCGSAGKHVVEIAGDEPTWLPESLRRQAQGEFTWLCTICGSYPAMKWPHDGGASSGMGLHLGVIHSEGFAKGMPRNAQQFGMTPTR